MIFVCTSFCVDAGFTTTVVAGLWPSLVKSLVLLNTAGKVVPDYKNLTYNKVKLVLLLSSFHSELLGCTSIPASHVSWFQVSTDSLSGLQLSTLCFICRLALKSGKVCF